MFPSTHPNIDVFLHNLKLIQNDTYIKLNSIQINETRYVRAKIVKKKEVLDSKIDHKNLHAELVLRINGPLTSSCGVDAAD